MEKFAEALRRDDVKAIVLTDDGAFRDWADNGATVTSELAIIVMVESMFSLDGSFQSGDVFSSVTQLWGDI
ncbi:hypothetical protein Hanom_Chr09g00763801 [Helianthus anomalus]